MFNFELDVIAADMDMLVIDWDLACGDFRPWRLVLIMVVQNNLEEFDKQKNNRDGCAGYLL